MSADNGRRVHECTVAGKLRRLRVSVGAARQFHDQRGRDMLEAVRHIGSNSGDLVELFVQFCAAGGTPLEPAERAAIEEADYVEFYREVVPAVTEALYACEVLERPGVAPTSAGGASTTDAAASAEDAKKKAT